MLCFTSCETIPSIVTVSTDVRRHYTDAQIADRGAEVVSQKRDLPATPAGWLEEIEAAIADAAGEPFDRREERGRPRDCVVFGDASHQTHLPFR